MCGWPGLVIGGRKGAFNGHEIKVLDAESSGGSRIFVWELSLFEGLGLFGKSLNLSNSSF